ncbi:MULTISPECIES: alpha/beta fold hydrolase [Nocardiaceae]|uniref:Pimeloyl-ACP methyl ester carboxylesterase n=1 Tax=Rhodococcoides corynebacterioides TaxID=53972 RepID=A0ABS2KU48_9NOCA|nr:MULTISPECIES: alpha/beta fold hydrolase [Rhodococcus]MBM7415469.1 pimeloyl-ACP methyl ester carboxylesterase [Rhodococcus corynebacterioides]MBP1117931.1 pimeloyl-ACP methyl ester carboxylesterase [Rhodococcus sp. PvP016]
MTSYVLVPGFWLGGWAWRDVAAELREQGHDVHTVSLTGMGERAHLAGPGVDLNTHVTDVVNVLQYGELDDVVLVGHSYAGAVVTPSVADRVPEKIASLVFVDTGPLPDGMSQSDFGGSSEPVGERVPPPRWDDLLASGAERTTRLSVAQPGATATSAVHYTGAWESIRRVFVMSSVTEAEVRESSTTIPAYRHMTGEFRELPGSHWPMFDQPAALAAVLAEVGRC